MACPCVSISSNSCAASTLVTFSLTRQNRQTRTVTRHLRRTRAIRQQAADRIVAQCEPASPSDDEGIVLPVLRTHVVGLLAARRQWGTSVWQREDCLTTNSGRARSSTILAV